MPPVPVSLRALQLDLGCSELDLSWAWNSASSDLLDELAHLPPVLWEYRCRCVLLVVSVLRADACGRKLPYGHSDGASERGWKCVPRLACSATPHLNLRGIAGSFHTCAQRPRCLPLLTWPRKWMELRWSKHIFQVSREILDQSRGET